MTLTEDEERILTRVCHELSTEYSAPGQTKAVDRKVRRMCYKMAILAWIGIVLMMIELQAVFVGTGSELDSTSTAGELLKISVSISTAYLMVTVVKFHMFLNHIDNLIWRVHLPIWRKPKLLSRFLLEMAVNVFHAFPGVAGVTGNAFDDKVGLFMFARLYHIIRIIRNESTIYKERRDLMDYSEYLPDPKAIFRLVFDSSLAVRAFLYKYPFRAFASLSILFYLFFVYVLYVTEREHNSDFNSGDVFFYTALLMTTVGNGSLVPVTWWGRMAASLASTTGVLLLGLWVVLLFRVIRLDDHEIYAYFWSLAARQRPLEREYAAAFVQLNWRRSRIKDEDLAPATLNLFEVESTRLARELRALRRTRQIAESHMYSDQQDSLLSLTTLVQSIRDNQQYSDQDLEYIQSAITDLQSTLDEHANELSSMHQAAITAEKHRVITAAAEALTRSRPEDVF